MMDRIRLGITHADASKRLIIVGHDHVRGPADKRLRLRQCRAQPGKQCSHIVRACRVVKAANLDTHRVHGTGAQQGHDGVAQSLQRQAAPDDVRIITGHGDCTVVTEVIRCRQQVDVQGMALYPLAAIQHAPHRLHPRPGVDAEQILQGVHRADLVRHRANAADARHHVLNFLLAGTTFEQFFEQTRRLVDLHPQRLDGTAADTQKQSPFAFHPRQHRHVDIDLARLRLIHVACLRPISGRPRGIPVRRCR